MSSNNFFSAGEQEQEGYGDILTTVRSKVLDFSLVIFAIAAIPGLGISYYRAIDVGWQNITFLHTGLAVILWLTAIFRHRLQFRIRATVCIVIIYAVGIAGMVVYWLSGHGVLFLIVSSFVVTLLFGIRPGLILTVATTALLACISIMVYMGWLNFYIDFNVYAHAPSSLLTMLGAYGMVTAIISYFAGQIHIYLIANIQRMTETEMMLKESLREKELLLKEIHHRVKNNMQIILSLLRLQERCTMDEEMITMLHDSQSRIRSMALVHDQIYRSHDMANIEFDQYVNSLVKELLNTYSVRQRIEVKVNIGSVRIGIDSAIPCGMILNEIISNSLKHAFPEGRGKIVIAFEQEGDGYNTMIVSDNGKGLPEDFTIEGQESLGLTLINLLVKQLDGEIVIDGNTGTRFPIRFPAYTG
jgi:two-component sensor histidine kinase